MIVKIPFNLINVNQSGENLEIVFPCNDKWYRMDWDKVPEKFKVLYVAYLRLEGIEIPDYLKEYEKDMIDISDVSIEMDLSQCEEIPEEYPL